jgi:hypothetical protein
MEDEKSKFLRSFEDKLREKLDKKALENLSNGEFIEDDLKSTDYEQFRIETLPESISFFEKYCNFSYKLFPIKADSKMFERINNQLYEAHLNTDASSVFAASFLTSLILMIIGLTNLIFFSGIIGVGFLLLALASYFLVQNLPNLLMKRLKAKANDQIIIAIFYIVAFMRFNSNFELAINFAANYLSAPLSLDFKRILWELENAKYPTIKVAFDKYLENWRDDNLEFLESVYLIESSLYESEEFRRISLLDKALDTILQGNYEKMLHFAQDLRGKVSTLNMIGVVLPILGLIILPLAASFGSPRAVVNIVFLLYNILFPFGVAYFAFLIIFNRPSSVNSIKIPNLKRFKNLQKINYNIFGKKFLLPVKYTSFILFLFFFLIGMIPILIHNLGSVPDDEICMSTGDLAINNALSSSFSNINSNPNSPFLKFQEYKYIDKEGGYCFGPYGLYPDLLSIFIPLSFAFGIGSYLKNKYKNLIHLRDQTKELEKQFPSATFQLGSRINEGIAAELAFGLVAETMKSTEAGNFFSKIDSNIKFSGMSLEKAIFDSDKGALRDYPSDLIVSSMKIFVRSVEKGPEVAAKTLIDLSRYLSDIHMSNERMLDLLSESIGSMKSQANFLAPIIAGIVISIVSLITMILGLLSSATSEISQQAGDTGFTGNVLGESLPTFLFQIEVGIYIITLIAILIYMVTNLENGDDPINTRYQIGVKIMSGMLKFSIITAIGILGFSFFGADMLSGIV